MAFFSKKKKDQHPPAEKGGATSNAPSPAPLSPRNNIASSSILQPNMFPVGSNSITSPSYSSYGNTNFATSGHNPQDSYSSTSQNAGQFYSASTQGGVSNGSSTMINRGLGMSANSYSQPGANGTAQMSLSQREREREQGVMSPQHQNYANGNANLAAVNSSVSSTGGNTRSYLGNPLQSSGSGGASHLSSSQNVSGQQSLQQPASSHLYSSHPPSSSRETGLSSSGSHPPSGPVSYPWSQRPIKLQPIQPLSSNNSAIAPPVHEVTKSPFPRYGHSVNPLAQSSTGDLYLFGGLVHEQVKNDLYMISCAAGVPTGTNSNGTTSVDSKALAAAPVDISLIETRGAVPCPRVGHASVSVGNVLIVWGGDTKTREEDPQDDNLYLLNLGLREWTLVKVTGKSPQGRYGHAAAMRGGKFYIFGGQQDVLPGVPDEDAFLNDLWCFDLQNLKAGNPHWSQIQYAPGAPTPPKRTGHTVVTYGECLYLFGGTDGQYHYNDTWCFNITTQTWSELSCIGYIPVPREGHAATLVDDVVYVFGGRSVDGKDLEDLAAFKISNQRWYMFTNMGPAPSGRSGHAMATWQNKVFVLGGESYTAVSSPTRSEWPNVVHMLDTGKIKYPSDSKNLGSRKSSNSRMHSSTSQQHQTSQAQHRQQDPNPAPSEALSMFSKPNFSSSEDRRAISPTASNRDNSISSGLNMSTSGPGGTTRGLSNGQAHLQGSPASGTGEDAQMTRKPADFANRTMSPVGEEALKDSHTRSMSPTFVNSHNGVQATTAVKMTPTLNGMHPSAESSRAINDSRTDVRSPSPSTGKSYQPTRSTDLDSQPDQYPLGNQPMNARLQWLQAALADAVQKGFVLPSGGDNLGELGREQTGQQRTLVESILSLRKELTDMKASLADEQKFAEERVTQATRGRAAALQEAAFYRSKAAALEANATGDVLKLERGRLSELDRKIVELSNGKSTLERKLHEMEAELDHHRNVAHAASERELASVQRAEAAEASYSRSLTDYADLQRRAHSNESSLHDHTSRVTTLESLLAQLKAQHTHASTKLANAESSLDQHLRTLEQSQAALTAANTQASELEALWTKAKTELAEEQEKTIALEAELQKTVRQLEVAQTSAVDLERALASSKEEVQSLRTLTSGHLSELVVNSRDVKNRGVDGNNSFSEQLQALKDEAETHRNIASDANTRASTAENEARDARLQHINLEKQVALLRAELAGIRIRHASNLEAHSRSQALVAQRELELREKARAMEAAEVKAGLLRSILSENGLTAEDPGMSSLDNEDVAVNPTRKVAELESRLEQSNLSHKEMQNMLEEARQEAESGRQRLRLSEIQIEKLTSQLEELKLTRADKPVNEDTSTAGSRAEEELVALKEKHAQLESTHVKAVQYVKGTEKMFRRMKDELTKYKEKNEALEAELAKQASSPVSSHSRQVSEDLRPELDSLRAQLAELRKQSEQSTAQNEELQRHIKSLRSEYDQGASQSPTISNSMSSEA